MWDAPISRRTLLTRCLLLALPSIGRAEMRADASREIMALETSSGARIGVAALDTGSGRTIFYRERERFLFCSTWKFLVVTALLARVDRGEEHLGRVIFFHHADLVPHAPATSLHLKSGMTLEALCAAAMTVSDNTAANLLLIAVGGLEGFNTFVRSLGDRTTVLNRNEPTVNVPDGSRDTTTPLAMLDDMKLILLGDALKPASRQLLRGWMDANTTGDTLLRAGLPKSWAVGDKTGRGDYERNDLAIVTPPGRKPILISVYTVHPSGRAEMPTLLAEIGRIVAAAFAV